MGSLAGMCLRRATLCALPGILEYFKNESSSQVSSRKPVIGSCHEPLSSRGNSVQSVFIGKLCARVLTESMFVSRFDEF